jgi:hypothetical protein
MSFCGKFMRHSFSSSFWYMSLTFLWLLIPIRLTAPESLEFLIFRACRSKLRQWNNR